MTTSKQNLQCCWTCWSRLFGWKDGDYICKEEVRISIKCERMVLTSAWAASSWVALWFVSLVQCTTSLKLYGSWTAERSINNQQGYVCLSHACLAGANTRSPTSSPACSCWRVPQSPDQCLVWQWGGARGDGAVLSLLVPPYSVFVPSSPLWICAPHKYCVDRLGSNVHDGHQKNDGNGVRIALSNNSVSNDSKLSVRNIL